MKKLQKMFAFLLAIVICLSFGGLIPSAVAPTTETAEITSISCVSNGLKIKWDAVKSMTEYHVFRWHKGIEEWEKIKTTTALSFTDSSVSSGTEYLYTVALKNGSNYNFGEIKAYTFLSAPDVTSAKRAADGISIKWKSVSGAESYKIYRKAGNGEYKKIATVANTKNCSYTDKKADEGVECTYKVRAYSGSCHSAYSVKKMSARFLKTPTLISVKNSPKGVTVTWKKNTAPSKYEIYRKTGSGEWKKAGTASSSKTSFIDKKASFGKKCTYKIRGITSKVKSNYSNRISVYALNPKKPAIALTFDDGPYSPVTNRILDSLKKNGGRATFFVVGSRVGTYKDCIKREAQLGCEIGCHTYNHAILTRLSKKEIKKEISSAVKPIEKYSGKKVKIVRAPGGAVNDTVKKSVDYPLVNWSIDTLDWQHRNTATTVSKIKSSARDGAIVLMHDLYVPTGDAAVKIIPWLVKQGYQLVTVSELFELKGINVTKGKLYTHG